jgi:prepilin-type N-terminal cleavage/methylation domain-containing protein
LRPIRRPAFTLIELLVVVAIIAILAGIALPNLLEAQTRAKVSRVKADLRTIATALESYAVDWNSYPGDGNGPPYRGLVAMTTPVAYMTSIFNDIFNTGLVDGRTGMRSDDDPNEDRTYELGTGNPGGPGVHFPARVWALAAYGPDRDDDTHIIGAYPFTEMAIPYDPTNGTISSGDVYRLGPQDRHPNFETDANPLTF